MKEKFNHEFSRLIFSKEVGKHTFRLWLIQIPDENYEFVQNYDYIIDGPNWLSGHLKAQGYNEEGVFGLFDSCGIDDVNSAWEAYNERGRC